MERLQAALEKARAQREGREPAGQANVRSPMPAAPSSPGATARAASQPQPQPAAGTWDEIPLGQWDRVHLAKHRVVAFAGGVEASAVDMLRTRIVQLMRQNGWKRVAITSPDKSAGKSTTCCNLLASLSRQTDRRTILFDLDLRRPALADILGHKGDVSFSAVLAGEVPFAKQAVRFSEMSAVAMNYRPERNPTELLLSDRTTSVLAQIEKTYQPDIMIFDMPPMLVTDDTLAFLKNVDCAVIVAGAESTTIDQIDVCEKEIAAQTNVLGVVLNKCKHMEQGYGYDYY
jgi:Mrp family chromosome partitioning ATPase